MKTLFGMKTYQRTKSAYVLYSTSWRKTEMRV